MVLCEQSGEPRFSADGSGELQELCHGIFFDGAQESRLPLTDGEVSKICESNLPSITLRYSILSGEKLPESLSATNEAIQDQEKWEARILKSFDANGYVVTKRKSSKGAPYREVYCGLEDFIDAYTEGMNSHQRAFLVRCELEGARLTPELHGHQLILEPREASPEKAAPGRTSFHTQSLAATSSLARAFGKRRRSDTFPFDDEIATKVHCTDGIATTGAGIIARNGAKRSLGLAVA
ncbi:hypothetical protein ACJZ2D_016512 [Fusarium nematophilum]